MNIAKKHLEEYKRIHHEQYGEELTDEQVYEASRNLVGLAEIFVEQIITDQQRKQQLTKEPKGFHLPDGEIYNCMICYRQVSGNETWYDNYGIKCMTCQKALNDKILPTYVCTKRESWLSDWQVQDKLNLHSATVRKMIREKKLNPRIVYDNNGEKYFQLFIIKENEYLLKNITHSPIKNSKTVNNYKS
ncbi:MAG: hypothetical protein V1838_05735 [Patescibacteria group bacterium]